MQPLRIMTLDLRSPLKYRRSCGADPFGAIDRGERMALFELDSVRAAAVEPDLADYLGAPALIAESGEAAAALDADSAAGAAAGTDEDAPLDVAIPAGRYLFAQLKPDGEIRKAELLAAAALELQRDGLWRAIALEPRVYLRVLAEGGGTVFQVLRPIAAADSAGPAD